MKVVIGTNGLGYGGAEAAVVTVANELARRAHTVTVWVLRTDEPMQRIDDFDRSVTLRTLAVNSFKSPAAVRRFRRAIVADSPDAALYIANPVAAGFHALLDRAPVFYWVQNYVRPPRIRWFEAGARLIGVRIVVLNSSVESSVIGPCHATIPNPMPPPSEKNGADARPPAWTEGRLLVVGRIVPQKDHAFLLEVMSLLQDAACPIELDVVGDGGMLEEVADAAREKGLARVVHFHGRVSSTPWFERRPMLVMTSHWEGQGVVLVEAANYGCPIVARDAPGVRDCLGAGYEGLTPHDRPEAMAEVIESWIRDPDRTTARARRLEERMRLQYSAQVVVDMWERVLQGQSASA